MTRRVAVEMLVALLVFCTTVLYLGWDLTFVSGWNLETVATILTSLSLLFMLLICFSWIIDPVDRTSSYSSKNNRLDIPDWLND